MDHFFSIASIVKTWGIRGEVCAEILTEFPDHFASNTMVRITFPSKQYKEEIESARFHKGRVLLKFHGRNQPHEVQELVGGDVQMHREKLSPLPEDSYYEFSLVGLQVEQDGRNIGVVVDLFQTGLAGTNLVIRNSRAEEIMIPMVKAFILEVDLDQRVINVDLPSGLVSSEVDL